MKQMLTATTIAVLLLLCFPRQLSAQTETLNTPSELIIQIPAADVHRNLPDIETAVQNLGGVTIVGFCNSQKCLYLTVDRTVHHNDQQIINTILGLGYQIEVKSSATIEQAQNDCKDRQ